ncbi:Sec-independent protein translocase protein TatB [Sphingomonas abietis]|uniref:Sec-independent protein translocase protein TatB n=1 Tax=Sphingomonas abietis TaxID=3012344 RepID=A0ABY7NKH5_9SPHN|nr:Sec-independent protein translocase protein TatB [Sphingomonas abietis]WBO22029.1 Sec-independent protein translocase protein TatB [Sphingomonas abietis]
MFDIAPSELMVVALVAIVFIGPKDLPRAMRFVGQWVGKGRTMARHFRSAMDEMVREAELAEMEQKWKAENERIMREHADLMNSVTAPLPAPAGPEALPAPAAHAADAAVAGDEPVPTPAVALAAKPVAPVSSPVSTPAHATPVPDHAAPAAPLRQPPEA